MKSITGIIFVLFIVIWLISCKQEEQTSDMNIIYLHHSTGGVIWKGTKPSLIMKAISKVSNRLANIVSPKPYLPQLFAEYNKDHSKNYLIKEMTFPKANPYGWNNYPYDYYNIWVKNAGDDPFLEEPTLEILTKEYQVIIFKHCFPVSNVQEDMDTADVNSSLKTISNYKLQYSALKDELHKYPDTKFILFTGAAQVKANITENEAKKAKEFFAWVTEEWDLPGDNIFLWDLYALETEGSLYLRDEYAVSPTDSHPNSDFARKSAKLLFSRIIDIIENEGNSTRLTGEKK